MMYSLCILTVALLGALARSESNIIIEGSEGGTVQLPCEVTAEEFDLEYWLRDNHILSPEGSYNAYKYYFHAGNKSALGIKELTAEDAGRYTCVGKASGNLSAATVRLTVIKREKVPQVSLWKDDYKYNLIRGIVAAFIFAAVFGITCAVHKYRWKSSEKKLEKKNKGIEDTPAVGDTVISVNGDRDGTANPAFEMDSKSTSNASSKENVTEVPNLENDTHM